MLEKQKLTPEERKREAQRYADELMQQGKSDFIIEKATAKYGYDREMARQVIKDVQVKQYNRSERIIGLGYVAVGMIICIIGITYSNNSYNAAAASPTGGTYVVTWGAILGGASLVLRGLFRVFGG